MSTPLTRRRVLTAVTAAGALSIAGCTAPQSLDVEETITDEFDAETVSRLVVETTNGDVTVSGESRDTIAFTATKRATSEGQLENVDIETHLEEGVLTLAVEVDEGLFSFLRTGPRVDLELDVPEDVNVTEGFETVESETTNGRVDVHRVRSDLSLMSTNGDVTGRQLEGGGVAGTTNGDISLEFEQLQRDLTAETTNGDVELVLPSTVDAALSLDTVNGTVTTENLGDGTLDTDGTTLDTTLGDGTHAITAETTNGNISVRGQ